MDAVTEKSLGYMADQLSRMENAMIDPREFGRLEAEVKGLQVQVTDLQTDVKQLLELANRSKGGFWVGMSIAGTVGGIITYLVERLFLR